MEPLRCAKRCARDTFLGWTSCPIGSLLHSNHFILNHIFGWQLPSLVPSSKVIPPQQSCQSFDLSSYPYSTLIIQTPNLSNPKCILLTGWVWRRLSFKAQEQEIRHQATSMLLLVEGVSIIDWPSVHVSVQGVMKESRGLWGPGDHLFCEDLSRVGPNLHGRKPWWNILVGLCDPSMGILLFGLNNRVFHDPRTFVVLSLHQLGVG